MNNEYSVGEMVKNLATNEIGIVKKVHNKSGKKCSHPLNKDIEIIGYTVEVDGLYKVWRPQIEGMDYA